MSNNQDTLMIAQYLLENEAKELGYKRYIDNQKYYEENNIIAKKETSRLIIKDRVSIISKLLESYEKEVIGAGAQYNKLLPLFKIKGNYNIAAYLGMQVALNSTKEETTTFTQVILGISREIKKEYDIQIFEDEKKDYYEFMLKDFKRKNITSVREKEKILKRYYAEIFEDKEKWSMEVRTHLGSKVMNAILEACPDIFYVETVNKNMKKYKYLRTTLDYQDWVEMYEENKGYMLPVYLPMVVKPTDWTGMNEGGYLTYQNTLKFVKTKNKAQKKYIMDNLPLKHMEAVNKLQSTGYRVNKTMLDIINQVYENNLGIYIPKKTQIDIKIPFPVEKKEEGGYTKEELGLINEWKTKKIALCKEEARRKGRIISYLQLRKIAERMKDFEEIFFVYNCDFRGRIYCITTDLTPQGSDLSKSLLEYSKGKKIGYVGIRELAINMANKFGMSKATREERFLWALENEENIRLTIEDPIKNNQFWSMADKPYQFLANCLEWANCNYGKDPEALTRIPCGLDGSCNGLQHYSAMLRDEVGAKATNLYNSEYPNDIYAEVADLCNSKLDNTVTSDDYVKAWQTHRVARKCTKRPVMTYVYGATKYSCKEYITEYLNDTEYFKDYTRKEVNEIAMKGSDLVYSSIEEIVSGASKAMKWLRSIPNKTKEAIKWLTPIGFPVYQPYVKGKSINIRVSFGSDLCAIKVVDYEREVRFDLLHQKNGIAPNFIHSLDATHLVLTIINSDLEAYTMIHDDYGTYACDIPKLKEQIKKSFYDLYSNHKPLEELASQLGVVCDLEYGNYELEEILDSEYFFD